MLLRVILTMFNPGYGALLLLFVGVPLALCYRVLLHREEKGFKEILDRRNVIGHYSCSCYDAQGMIPRDEACLILLLPNTVEINYGMASEKIEIPYEDIVSVECYKLDEIQKMDVSNRKKSFGQLGASFPRIKKKRKSDSVDYLFLKMKKQGKNVMLCFFISGKSLYINQLFQTSQDVLLKFEKKLKLAKI